MRAASVLFSLLLVTIVLFNAMTWMNGAPVRITLLMSVSIAAYFALAVLLWRRNRIATVAGLIVAGAGAFIFGGATYAMWPITSTEFATARGTMEVVGTMIAPLMLNLAIVLILAKALLSNNRMERAREP